MDNMAFRLGDKALFHPAWIEQLSIGSFMSRMIHELNRYDDGGEFDCCCTQPEREYNEFEVTRDLRSCWAQFGNWARWDAAHLYGEMSDAAFEELIDRARAIPDGDWRKLESVYARNDIVDLATDMQEDIRALNERIDEEGHEAPELNVGFLVKVVCGDELDIDTSTGEPAHYVPEAASE